MTIQESKRESFLESNRRIKEKETNKVLEIAKKYSMTIEERGDLETRNSDSEDFIEISVWNLKKMLLEAYEKGKLNN